MLGFEVGSYRIVREIGQGGMGRVYLAEHTLIGKRAAVKVLLPQFSANDDIVNRFFNEARASSFLKHPGVVDVYDFGTLGSSAYLIMEYLEGETLSARLKREPLAAPLVVDIARQVAGALAAAHARGIIHRDLKPDNVFLVADADLRHGLRAKVLDFGIAKLSDAVRPPRAASTVPGAIIGTPSYMSPEQCRGSVGVDHRTDVYALGCLMYEMATGRPPFIAEAPAEVLAAHAFQPVPSLDGTLPRRLAALVVRMLAKHPDGRVQSMTDVVTALSAAELIAPTPTDAATARVKAAAARARAVAPTLSEKPRESPPAPSTTLGGAAGEVAKVRRAAGAARWIAGGAALALALGGAAVLWHLPPASHEAPVTVPAVAVPAATPVAAPVAPAPRRVRVELDSDPEGAEVFGAADGVRLGTTPLVREYPAGSGHAVFVLKLRGYRDATANVSLAHDASTRVLLGKRPSDD